MKRTDKIISLVMTIVMIFSLTGCHKKIKKIDEDDIIDALEEVLDLEETDDSSEWADGYYVNEDNPDREIIIRGYVNDFSSHDDNIVITYIINKDDDDSEEHFADYYEITVDNPMHKSGDYRGYYNEGEHGYMIVEKGEIYNAMYYADDMILEVSAHSEERIEEAKDFIRALGLPV